MTPAEKPAIRPFDGSAIPQALREQRRWAPWRAVWNAKKQKYDKVPHRADRPEYGISSAKPEQWFSYETALAAFRRNPQQFAGIGYVMTGAHGITGVDLDHCVEGGAVAPWALDVVAQLGSYTEISPSGTGLRVMVLGEVSTDWVNHDVGIEIYGGNEARFLTVTGEHLAGSPADVRAPREGVLKALESRYAKERRKADVIDLNMPEVLDELLLPDLSGLSLPHTVLDFLAEGLHSGDRSRALFSSAVALYGAGLADDEVFSVLANSEHALEIALDHRRQDHDRALLYLWREHCCKGKARAAELAPLSLDDFEVLPAEEGAAPAADHSMKGERFRVLAPGEFLQRKRAGWIVKGVLPRAGLALLVGASGSGKTFWVLDLVAAIARGIEWRGHKVTKGRAVVIAAEGAGGFRNRLEAYMSYHGVDLAGFDVGVIPDAPNFLVADDVKAVVAALRTFGKLDVIVVDTYAQVMPGGDENGGVDGGKVVKHCQLLHKLTGALVILVHHVGKDLSKGARGWSGLRAAADVEITVERAQDHRAATVTKQKDGEEGQEFGFRLNTVSIGEDDEGEEITSCVVEHTAAVAKAEQKKDPKGDNEKVVLKLAQELTGLVDEDVPVNALIEACVNQMVPPADGKRDRRREVVVRAIESLQAANRLNIASGAVRVL
ncbi:MAG: AAA family ATPase [Telluria sp.]